MAMVVLITSNSMQQQASPYCLVQVFKGDNGQEIVQERVKHVPDEEMQALLQAAQPNRPITTLWANHEEKWREFSPDDLSAASCHRYLTHRFFILKDLDPVSDPRKLQQLIAGIFRYTHQIRNMSRAMTAFEEALDEESHDQYVE